MQAVSGESLNEVHRSGCPINLSLEVFGGAAAGGGHGLCRQRPGEAREADLGVASGNGKGQIFVKGKVIKTVPESRIVETLVEEEVRLADEMGAEIPEELSDLVPGATVTCTETRGQGGLPQGRPPLRVADAGAGRSTGPGGAASSGVNGAAARIRPGRTAKGLPQVIYLRKPFFWALLTLSWVG
jgi:hypothetical protein